MAGCCRANGKVTYTSVESTRFGIGGSPWGAVWLGGVLMLAGLFVVVDVVAAKTASTILFGLALLAAGTFELVHAFWAPHWGGFFLRLLLGLFYAISGAMLVAHPLVSSNVLTIAFAATLMASGVVRVCLAHEYWQRHGDCSYPPASSASSPALLFYSNGRSPGCGPWAWWSASTCCCMGPGGSCSV